MLRATGRKPKNLQKITALSLTVVLLVYCTPISIKRVASNSFSPSWLQVGKFAQYSAIGPTVIWTYNESLDLSNCTIAKRDMAYLESTFIDPDEGGYFIFRWEVISITQSSITLQIELNTSDWWTSTFKIKVNGTTRETYYESIHIGQSCLWLTEDRNKIPEITVASNPVWTANSNILIEDDLALTPQGYQNCLVVEATEDDYHPPYHDSRTPYTLHLYIDDDSRLLVGAIRQLILPFPIDYRFVVLSGWLQLDQTNIDLGPDVLLPNFASAIGTIILLSLMLIAIIVLSGVIFLKQRKGRRRKKDGKRAGQPHY